MDDTAIRRYFTQPTNPYHRQYEALRAVILDGRSQKEVASTFGFQYRSLRQLVYEFRGSFNAERSATQPPFFKPSRGIARLQARQIPPLRQSRTGNRWSSPATNPCA
jgi:hypothetical protein